MMRTYHKTIRLQLVFLASVQSILMNQPQTITITFLETNYSPFYLVSVIGILVSQH